MRTVSVLLVGIVFGISVPVAAGDDKPKNDPCAEALAIAFKRIADLEAEVAKLKGGDGSRTIDEATQGIMKPHDPIKCTGNQTMRLTNVHIKATDLDGAAIRAEGKCYIILSDSLLEGPTGIWLMGRAHVVVKNSSVKGLRFGASIENSSKLTAQGTTFYGPMNRRNRAVYSDQGGNSWAAAPSSP